MTYGVVLTSRAEMEEAIRRAPADFVLTVFRRTRWASAQQGGQNVIEYKYWINKEGTVSTYYEYTEIVLGAPDPRFVDEENFDCSKTLYQHILDTTDRKIKRARPSGHFW